MVNLKQSLDLVGYYKFCKCWSGRVIKAIEWKQAFLTMVFYSVFLYGFQYEVLMSISVVTVDKVPVSPI